jgi:hypothetical protein
MSNRFFPWDEIEAARDNADLQSRHDSDNARLKYGNGVQCPSCSKPGEQLTWFRFTSPAWKWKNLCGRAGWMAVCDDCHVQAAFICEMEN